MFTECARRQIVSQAPQKDGRYEIRFFVDPNEIGFNELFPLFNNEAQVKITIEITGE